VDFTDYSTPKTIFSVSEQAIYQTKQIKKPRKEQMRTRFGNHAAIFIILFILIIASKYSFFRYDLTSDKRYSIAEQTVRLLKNTNDKFELTIYLDGDLNPGFLKLRNATQDLLSEMSIFSNKGIKITLKNPSLAESAEERNKKYQELESLGMRPTAIYELDKEGKSIQKIVFPWLKISYKNKTVFVNLLKNIAGLSGEENLNISIENLEFEITDAIRRITNTKVSKIAFIEGHGELNEADTYSISKLLSRYFQVDRGILGDNPAILEDYKAIIIAQPTEPFSESDKYIIDQYIMQGGKVLWLIDGVKIQKSQLSETGLSPAMALDLNLNDQLFKYGVRINPVLIQDIQCTRIPINIAAVNDQPQFEPSPWYFAPLLLTSYQHPITKNISEVRSEFCSTISLVGENTEISASLLLATSDNSHAVGIPTIIDLAETLKPKSQDYFDKSYEPVAVLLEGKFESVFKNRMTPKEINTAQTRFDKSVSTKQVFIANGEIIRNETNGIASDSTTLALGYDRYMNQQFGNQEFLQNAILYLTDEEGWIDLRSRSLKLRLLNKKIIQQEASFWKIFNILFPLSILLIFGFVYFNWRKRKYRS
jgi:ABC-2 type transport system permease protein